MSNIVVRQAQISDAEGIATVHVFSWQKTYRGLMPDKILDTLTIEGRTARWQEMLREPTFGTQAIVTEKNNKIIGWATFGKNRDEDVESDTGELWAIYVHPDSLGIGAGSIMMDKALAGLKEKGYKKVTLWVLTTNKNARNWYENKGWKNEGSTKMDKRAGHDLHETRYIKDLI